MRKMIQFQFLTGKQVLSVIKMIYFIMADSKFLQDYMCVPFVDRVDLTVTSYIDENTDANVFKGRARFAAGFNNWRGMALCGAGMAEGTDLTALNG